MIRKFTDIRKQDINIVGSKGINLGEMARNGMNVPNGFVVTGNAYRLFLKENKLEKYIEEKLKEAGDDERELLLATKDIRKQFLSASVTEEIKYKIEDEYRKLGRDVRVAVRPSVIESDSQKSSARRYEAFLNVQGAEAVIEQIKCCYAAFGADMAAVNCQGADCGQDYTGMAVIVQRMVESSLSGVMFTANPVNNNRNEVQINASYGLGKSVVSGRVTADTYICDKDGNLKTVTVGDKKTMIVYADNGTKETDVSAKLQNVHCLDDTQLIELCVCGRRVERFFNKPMDIEWGIAGKSVYIFQAKPVTTLEVNNEKIISEDDINKYVKNCKISDELRKNMAFILDKMPVPFYPLDSDMVHAINDQKSNILKEVGIIMSLHPQTGDDGVTVLPSAGKKFTKDIFNFFSLIKELKNYGNCRTKLDEQIKEFKKQLDEFAGRNYVNMSLKEACDTFTAIHDFVGRISYSKFKYSVFPSFFCKGKLSKILAKADGNLTIYDLYSNTDDKTALVARDIAGLSDIIKTDEKLKNDILDGVKYDRICEKYPKIKQEFDKFMKADGFKADFSFYCLYGKSFMEEPDRLINIIKPLLTAAPVAEEEKFKAVTDKIKSVCNKTQFEKINRNIDDFRYFHICSEEIQYCCETAFYYAKQALRRMSELIYKTDDFNDNLAYLFLNELKSAANKGNVSEELQAKIDMRKANRPLAYKVWDRCKMIILGEPGEVLRGVSASCGEVVGKVCIINGPEEFYKIKKEDILVCKYTDPEWTPLFGLARAVVADTGAALSHAAIAAREYKIPAVLGVGFATVTFKDGDTIRVDGTKGEVAKVG